MVARRNHSNGGNGKPRRPSPRPARHDPPAPDDRSPWLVELRGRAARLDQIEKYYALTEAAPGGPHLRRVAVGMFRRACLDVLPGDAAEFARRFFERHPINPAWPSGTVPGETWRLCGILFAVAARRGLLRAVNKAWQEVQAERETEAMA